MAALAALMAGCGLRATGRFDAPDTPAGGALQTGEASAPETLEPTLADLPTPSPTAAPPLTEIETSTPTPRRAGAPELVWLPHASGAFGGDVLAVREGAPAREPVPEALLIELFWDFDRHTGRLAFAGRFWHATEGTNKSVSDLWVYDYATGEAERWLADNVVRALWAPSPDPVTGRSPLAVLIYRSDLDQFDLIVMNAPGAAATVAEHASPQFGWSRGGSLLAFARTESYGVTPELSPGLYTVSVSRGNERQVSDFAYEQGGWIGDRPLWIDDPPALLYADSPLGIALRDGRDEWTPEGEAAVRPLVMLWSAAHNTLVAQSESDFGGSSVWAYRFSDDLRRILDSSRIGAARSELALVGWLEPDELVLLAEQGGYGAPVVWSLAEGKIVEPP